MVPCPYRGCFIGGRLCEGADNLYGIRCAHGFFPGCYSCHYRHLLSVPGRQHRFAENVTEKEILLLQAGKFRFGFRNDLPDEAECRRAGKYLYSVHSGSGNPFQLPELIRRGRRYAEEPVPQGNQSVCRTAGAYRGRRFWGKHRPWCHEGGCGGSIRIRGLSGKEADGVIPAVLWRILYE